MSPTVSLMRVAGADIWRGRWVVVVLDDCRFERVFLCPSIDAALDEVPDALVIGVDMPIGLPEGGRPRSADVQAREYVGRRWQSVFMTPSIELLSPPSQAEANDVARANGWAGISAQAYALRTTVLQVQPVAIRDVRVYEVHPEVSFVRANREAPLPWAKGSWNGIALRRRILDDHGIVIPDDLGAAGVAGVADVLDAAIAAWSASRVAAGEAESMPEGSARIGAIWR